MDFLILLVMGLAFSGFGGYAIWNEWKFFKTAIRVPGVIVSYNERRARKGGKVYAPVVAFEFDGENREVTGSLYSSGKPKIGEQRIVGVDPLHIEKARIYAKGNFVFLGFFLLIGLLCIAGAIFHLLN